MAIPARTLYERLAGTSPHSVSRPRRAVQKGDTINSRLYKDRDGALALATAYTAAVKGKKAYMRSAEAIKNFYLVDAIISAIVEDSLTPDITTGEVVEVTSNKSSVNKSLKELTAQVDFDQLVRDVAPELVSNGEYTVGVTNEKGITEVNDNVNQSRVVAFYDKGTPSNFLIEGDRDITIARPYQFAHFVIGDFKLRLKLDDLFEKKKTSSSQTARDAIPDYARIGKPLFFGTLGKIKELQLLESLIPAAKLNQITRGSIVGVGVPNASTPSEAFDICRRYENVFNASLGIDRADGSISVTDIIGVAGKVKAVPLFGDKGSLENIGSTRNNESVDDLLNNVKDLREIITSSLGYPPELLFGGEAKSELLKRYARYLRKLKSVQTALASGIKQICLIHLNNPGEKNPDSNKKEDFSVDDISVRFRNELVNIDELEKLEFSDAMISTVKETFTFLQELKESETMADMVNNEGVHAWLYNIFRLLSTSHDLINPVDDNDIAKRKPSSVVKLKPEPDPGNEPDPGSGGGADAEPAAPAQAGATASAAAEK